MKYDYEYKRKCIEKYRRGEWEETPEGMNERGFHYMIRTWARMERACGPEVLKARKKNKKWTADEKYELVAKVIGGGSCGSVAITAGIDHSLLRRWVKKYIMEGYQGLAAQRKGRQPKEASMKKKAETGEPTEFGREETVREEIARLKRENERLRAENEVIKKEIALREERQAAQLKARKQRLSKNSTKKDTH